MRKQFRYPENEQHLIICKQFFKFLRSLFKEYLNGSVKKRTFMTVYNHIGFFNRKSASEYKYRFSHTARFHSSILFFKTSIFSELSFRNYYVFFKRIFYIHKHIMNRI